MATGSRWGYTRLDQDTERRVVLYILAAVVATLVVLPVGWLIVDAISVPATRAIEVLTGGRTARVLANSLALVFTVTLTSICLGVPLAVLTVRTDLPFRRLFTVAAALPLVVPSYIGAFAFVSAFGPGGLLTHVLAPIGIATIPAINGFLGTAVVLTLFTYPYVFITTRASLLAFDTTLVDAARTLNHSRRTAFRWVTLPQIAPGIAAGALLVALYTLSDFGTPAIMRFDVFTRVIYVWSGAAQQDVATLLSLLLMGVTILIIAAESRLTTGDANGYAGGEDRGGRYRLGRWRWLAAGFCALVAAAALLLPVGILGLWLFREGPAYAGGGFDFHWGYALNSVYVSILAAAVAVLASLPVGYLSARRPTKLTWLFDRSTYVGYAVPGVVIGLALVSFTLNVLPSWYRTIPILVFAYVVRFVPQAVGSTRASVLQVNRDLLEAARTLGRPPASAFRRVVLPLITPGLSAGAALVFLTTMKELPATLLLTPPGFDTIVTFIWRVRAAGYYGEAAIPALILVALSALSMAVILRRGETDAR